MTDGGVTGGLDAWAAIPVSYGHHHGAATINDPRIPPLGNGPLPDPAQRSRHARSRHSKSGPAPFRVPPPLDERVLADGWAARLAGGWLNASDRLGALRLNPRAAVQQRSRHDALDMIARPTDDVFHIAVVSMKGGVGKTTTTLCLGSLLAANRTDRVIAIDAGPDRGTLVHRVRQGPQASFNSLLSQQTIDRYSEMRAYTRMSSGHLEVLGGEQDASVASEFTGLQYRQLIDIAHDYYSVMISDCGTGVTNSATVGALSMAQSVILVTSPALDSLRSTAATLKWLTLHGYSNLAREAHIVLSVARSGSPGIRLTKVHEHFQARCRSFHVVPFDPHLAEGGVVEIDQLSRGSNRAYLGLATAIAEGFTGRRDGRESNGDGR